MTSIPINAQAASVFQGIADILDAQGENPFKVRAYRNAVRTLEELPEAVSDIAARGELRQVPGFGEAIAGKLGEILQTGTCELYERLKAESQPQTTPQPIDETDIGADSDHNENVSSPW